MITTLRTVRILQEGETYYFTMEVEGTCVYTSAPVPKIEECIEASLLFLDEVREIDFHKSRGTIFGVLHA